MPVPFQATHHQHNYESTIDYICIIIASPPLDIIQLRQPWISEHDVLLVTLDLVVSTHKSQTITRRCFKNFDQEAFQRDLSKTNWPIITRTLLAVIDDKVDFLTLAELVR